MNACLDSGVSGTNDILEQVDNYTEMSFATFCYRGEAAEPEQVIPETELLKLAHAEFTSSRPTADNGDHEAKGR